ncbi:TIGR03086 family metal-binding protein [Streptomyces sp. NPDC051940]|uniref:TIGR03086 family metal-binding protein n=1 Tax=Streptomyces sp. NPDC051940 TaxID=3155675 RepID=UPI0034193532
MNGASTEVRAGVSLLERAVGYTLGVLPLVTDEALGRATPCERWDLRLLLVHLEDSLAALNEAVDCGHVSVSVSASVDCGAGAPPPGPDADTDAARLVGSVRDLCRRLIAAWSCDDGEHEVIDVGGLPLSSAIVTGTGAIEIAVHGWDIARACGADRPLPAPLAEELLDLAPHFVHPLDRPVRFADPVRVPHDAAAGERLLGFLGRRA